MNWLTNEGSDAVDFFWRSAGELEEYPRSLERPLALALPIAIVKLPNLKLKDIENWLRQRRVSFSFDCQSRYVHGCLLAYGGNGLIFVDGGDPVDQIRFTLAHEIAHFLLDYWKPRHRAVQTFGPAITEVMDGLRGASLDDRVRSLLSSIPIGVHTDLLERGERVADLSHTWKVEDQADKVALVLLAPPQDVLPLSDTTTANYEQRRSSITTVLIDVFGLPEAVAKVYSLELLSTIGKGPSWAETLGLR